MRDQCGKDGNCDALQLEAARFRASRSQLYEAHNVPESSTIPQPLRTHCMHQISAQSNNPRQGYCNSILRCPPPWIRPEVDLKNNNYAASEDPCCSGLSNLNTIGQCRAELLMI